MHLHLCWLDWSLRVKIGFWHATEAVSQKSSVKTVFLKSLQNSQESTCARVSFLIKLQAAPATLLKKRLWHRCFSVNFERFLRIPFFIEHLRWLLLTLAFKLLKRDQRNNSQKLFWSWDMVWSRSGHHI